MDRDSEHPIVKFMGMRCMPPMAYCSRPIYRQLVIVGLWAPPRGNRGGLDRPSAGGLRGRRRSVVEIWAHEVLKGGASPARDSPVFMKAPFAGARRDAGARACIDTAPSV